MDHTFDMDELLDEREGLYHSTPSVTEVLEKLVSNAGWLNFGELIKEKSGALIMLQKKAVFVIRELIRIADEHGLGIIHMNDKIYVYNYARWISAEENDLSMFLAVMAEKMGVLEETAYTVHFRKLLYRQLACSVPRPQRPRDGKTRINLLNGTLVTGKDTFYMRDFDKHDYLTYQLPFAYNADAGCPIFDTYLQRVLPEQELRNILAEFIGYVFIDNSQMKLEKALVLLGSGMNGKSVFFEIISALLGRENVSAYSISQLTDEKGYTRVMIADKMLNYSTEIDFNIRHGLLKQLISGEDIDARRPYGEPFTMNNYARLIFNTNELPPRVEQTLAYFRRFLIIPFRQTITKEEKDIYLAKKIIDNELPGVLNWVLDGLKRLIENNDFTPSDIVDMETNRYRDDSSAVFSFMEDHGYVKDPDNEVRLKELFDLYKVYCDEFNFRSLNIIKMRSHLTGAGWESYRKNMGIVVYCRKTNNSTHNETLF